MGLRHILLVALVPYAGWLIVAYDYHFLDGVNLAFHEAGHLFLSFGGSTLHFMGGTLGQLFFPVAAAGHFLRQQQAFDAAVCALWFNESLMNVARYLADARAQQLPLVGGHTHDWAWLLSRFGVFDHCEAIGAGLHWVASAGVVASLAWAALSLRTQE